MPCPRAACERRERRDAQRVQAAVRNRVAALTAAPAGQLGGRRPGRVPCACSTSRSARRAPVGVSRSAVEQWLERGVPLRGSRAPPISPHRPTSWSGNLKPRANPRVVREPAAAYAGAVDPRARTRRAR